MKSRALRSTFLLILMAAMGAAAFPAGINVDHIELLTHGGLEGGKFTVGSRLYYDMSLEGGDKFAGLLRLEYLSGSVEEDLYNAGLVLSQTGNDATDIKAIIAKLNALVSPRLRTAAVTARRVFGTPLEAAYFVGYLDTVASGDDYMALFGSAPFGTELRGPMVYPEGVGGNADLYYEGLDAVYGTGLRLGLVEKAKAFYLYAYQDADIAAGAWSALFRALFDSGSLKLEAFGGASLVSSAPLGLYRAGLLFDYAPGNVGEFFAQVGMTSWNPSEGLGIKNFYFLFEPRINFYPGTLAVTVFYHPYWYRQKETGESGAFDLNLNLKFGDISKTGAQGGATTLLSFRPPTSADTTAMATIDLSPYYSVISSGVEWSFKLDLRLFPFPSPWYGMFRPYVGVKTSF